MFVVKLKNILIIKLYNNFYLMLKDIKNSDIFATLSFFIILFFIGIFIYTDYGLSVDDFGTQCSNFSQLGTYDFESLKIDGKFIKDIDTNEQSKIITESILFFTKKIGFNTVAEFVHSEKIFEIVKDLGVTYAQGYYFGEPKQELIE